ncbi:MAG: hypothetical protein IIZ51_03265, partial [Lachnospiraceae bacterium]|nr:hypothetical protein [Lachnospiraceae bacterium]
SEDYLDTVRNKINQYSLEYKQLYTECYDMPETYAGTSVQSVFMKGVKAFSRTTQKAVSKVPKVNRSPIKKALTDASEGLEDLDEKRKLQLLQKMIDRQSSCVRPFAESIEVIREYYNNPVNLLFDNDTLYFGIAEDSQAEGIDLSD